MARNDQLIRQWKIIRLLDSRFGVTITQLMQQFRVTRRTIERDLDALEQAGFPTYHDTIEGVKRWKFADTFKAQLPIPFTFSELLSLYFSRNILEMFASLLFKQELDSICTKLQSLLPEKSLQYLDQLQSIFQSRYLAEEEYPYLRKIMPELEQAMLDETEIKMEYYSNLQDKWRTLLIQPYAIFPTYDRLYLVGNVPKHDNLCIFALSRIRKIELTGIKFHKPKDFSISQYMQTAFGIIRDKPEKFVIRFNPAVVSTVRKRCKHLQHTCQELPNGELLVTMNVSGWDEIKWWILSFGENAVVIEPKSMRTEIKQTLQTALKNYAK